MKHLIKENRHYATPFPWPTFYKKRDKYTYSLNVKFDGTVRYDIGEDQSDVNKLFGLSYGFHQCNSDRFGWRYNIEKDMVEIVAYSYCDGDRIKTHSLGFIEIGQDVDLKLSVSFLDSIRKVTFTMSNVEQDYTTSFAMDRVYFVGYTLGLYFGGNKRAPHDINVYINKDIFI